MASNAPGRRQSTRQVKNTVPRNYYDRISSGRGVNSAGPGGAGHESQPGFFPAITHFTDAIDALPKEVVRHFSMLKEVEAKLHAPDEELRHLADAISNLPPPPSRNHTQAHSYFPSLSAQNSINGSRNGSIVGPQLSDNQTQQSEGSEAADRERQQLFYRLSYTIVASQQILDEKIALLSTANQTLVRGLERMESSYIHIPEEISDEARLGNTKHWAYVTDKETKKAAPERTRREVAAHTLAAAAAAAAADGEIAARSELRREAVAARKNRAQHVDSDFDDRPPPKKGPGKGRKAADDAKSVGLGITNGVGGPNKRRKVVGGAPMERSISGAMSGALRGTLGSPRETPELALGKKRTKPPGPVPRKRNIGAQSPALASSPIVSSFAQKELLQKPQTSRVRQSSTTTSILAAPVEHLRGRPSSSASNKAMNGTTALSAIEQLQTSAAAGEFTPIDPSSLIEPGTDTLKHEDVEAAEDVAMAEAEPALAPVIITTRAGRQSKTATPMSSTFPVDLGLGPRNRTARTMKERDNASVSHASSESGERTTGRRKKGTNSTAPSTRGGADNAPEDEGEVEGEAVLAEDAELGEDEGVGEDGDGEADEEEDGEPKYCYCNDVSYGEMVACDNESCPREWFHLKCAGLARAPDENTKWYCDDCKEKMAAVVNKKGRPSSRREQ